MAQQMKILCACLGNGDRSPYMKAFLEQMLANQGRNDVVIDSAGVLETAKSGGEAPALPVKLAPTYGLDLSSHRKKHVSDLELNSYDLIIVADKRVQEALVIEYGVPAEIICLELEGANNAWMSQNSRKVEAMIAQIQYALTVEVIQYKFRVA